MSLSAKTTAECLAWEDHHVKTLLYTIALGGADDTEEWGNELICELILSASRAISHEDSTALDLACALKEIYAANTRWDRRCKKQLRRIFPLKAIQQVKS